VLLIRERLHYLSKDKVFSDQATIGLNRLR